jgi:hypothetical protein
MKTDVARGREGEKEDEKRAWWVVVVVVSGRLGLLLVVAPRAPNEKRCVCEIIVPLRELISTTLRNNEIRSKCGVIFPCNACKARTTPPPSRSTGDRLLDTPVRVLPP